MYRQYADIALTFLLSLAGAGLVVLLIAHWLDARSTSRTRGERARDHRSGAVATEPLPPRNVLFTCNDHKHPVDDCAACTIARTLHDAWTTHERSHR